LGDRVAVLAFVFDIEKFLAFISAFQLGDWSPTERWIIDLASAQQGWFFTLRVLTLDCAEPHSSATSRHPIR
jgi:hypothetical protein